MLAWWSVKTKGGLSFRLLKASLFHKALFPQNYAKGSRRPFVLFPVGESSPDYSVCSDF